MKLVVGLGNPGREYCETPHNIGFQAVDFLAENLQATWKQELKFNAHVTKVVCEGTSLWLMKPQTFMNLSGQSVSPFMQYFGIAPADLLVLSDDCDLPMGKVRLRSTGSSGGHKGLQSIITQIGTQNFARLRLGVGRNGFGQLKDYVLSRYDEKQKTTAKKMVQIAEEIVKCWLTNGVNEAMNRFNSRQAESSRTEAERMENEL